MTGCSEAPSATQSQASHDCLTAESISASLNPTSPSQLDDLLRTGNDLRLLALDGGGVRGLSALMILQQLMETIDRANPPKPCDYFDMIGGTSTGGQVVATAVLMNIPADRLQPGLLLSCSVG